MDQDHGDADDDVIDEMGERGHILWIRGLSRLQHQVSTASLEANTRQADELYVETEIRPVSQFPNLFIGTPRICNLISLFIVWVRSFSKMLPSVKFAEDKVLVFVILPE